MATVLNVDHRIIAGTTLAITTGIAAYSTYRLWALKREKKKHNVYETQASVHEYLMLHYATPEEILPYDFGPKNALDFPKRCAALCLKHCNPLSGVPSRALDIGCAVGRSTFELTQAFDEVVGIDYSHSFVDTCNLLKDHGRMGYFVPTVGDLVRHLEASVDSSLVRNRAVFQQGDACNLALDLGQFGCVLAANLICRLHTPRNFLNRLRTLVAPGGILVLTSPYSFSREFTPRENWIGGFEDTNGTPITGFDGLRQSLGDYFDLVAEEDMPFFIRETARKNQWTVSHATVWKRKK